MAAIFTSNLTPHRVSSPWPSATTPPSRTALFSEDPPSGAPPAHLSSYSITRLQAEPEVGPTEYKLHLLLRPRRRFKFMSTRTITTEDGRVLPAPQIALSGNGNNRQDRLQHLTTQLLWRMQQSSPSHTGASSDTVIPKILEGELDIDTVPIPEKLPPGLEESQGALYEIGVADDGTLVGLTKSEMDESIKTLRVMAVSLRCNVKVLRMIIVGKAEWEEEEEVKKGLLWVAEVFVTPRLRGSAWHSWSVDAEVNNISETEQLRVSLTGPTTSGKSTLLGTLTTGTLDSGRGTSRQRLLKHRHEVESGLTSSVAQELIGYKDRAIANYASHYNDGSWGGIHNASEGGRLVFLSDSAGHPRYRRTTLRGIIGWAPHWIFLCVAADDNGRSSGLDLAMIHLNLCLKLRMPMVIVVTKMDRAQREVLQQILGRLLTGIKREGRSVSIVHPDKSGEVTGEISEVYLTKVKKVTDGIKKSGDFLAIVPILLTSAVNGQGIGLVHALLSTLPKPPLSRFIPGGPDTPQPTAIFHIDDVFNIPITSTLFPISSKSTPYTVISGYLQHGPLSLNDKILLGPFLLDSDDSDNEKQKPTDQPSNDTIGFSISHPASEELAQLALGNCIMAASTEGRWVKGMIVSLRNLKLPVGKLLEDQAGTIGIITEGAPISIRRGMAIVKGISNPAALPSAAAITVSCLADATTLTPGQFVNIYVNCVRSAARIRKVARIYSGDSGSDNDGMFGMDGDGDGDEGEEDGKRYEVTLDLLARREWVEIGSTVAIFEGCVKDRTGLKSVVGEVVGVE